MTTSVMDAPWGNRPKLELVGPSGVRVPPNTKGKLQIHRFTQIPRAVHSSQLTPESEQGVYSESVRELVSQLLQLVLEHVATEKPDDYSVRSLANEIRWLRQDIQRIYREVKRVQELEERVGRLEQLVPTEKVIVLRDISREEAKQEIKRLFSGGNTLYYSDIAAELGLNLSAVVDICNELIAESEIEEVKDQQANA